ncbi:MAG: OmpH family outer membrane protein, partial [Gemmatimonadota bacterium]|nr:OmpH family outer membrane protein [Gemmatimonadota bacterium]
MSLIVRAAGALAVLTALTAANSLQAQTAAPAPVTKIGFINSQKIIAAAPGRDEAEAQFRKEMAGYQAQVQKLQDSLKTIIDTYTKQEPTMSAVARDGKQKEIQAKEADYQNRVRQLESQAQQREGELVKPIMDQINKIIETMRAEDNYSMIFD